MATPPKQYDSAGLDLSARFRITTDITGSPAAGVETIVATLPALPDIFLVRGVILRATVAFTVGTDGVSANLKIRRTNAAGTAIAATGATNTGALAATQLTALAIEGLDTGPTLPGQVYVATLLVGSGSAESTVSAVSLVAVVV